MPKSRPRPIPRLRHGLNRDRVRDRDQESDPRPRLFVRDRESRQCLMSTQKFKSFFFKEYKFSAARIVGGCSFMTQIDNTDYLSAIKAGVNEFRYPHLYL